MPIIPNLNLKAAERVNDAALNPVSLDQPSSSGATTQDTAPESIDESRPCNVKPSFSGDELSPPPNDDFDFDDAESDFKSPPPYLLTTDSFRMELTEEPTGSSKPEQADKDITSRRLADLVYSEHVDTSAQSFSDADSASEHSIQSDTSYTKEALQIVANSTSKQQQLSITLASPLEPQSPANSVPEMPPRKRRRAVNKLNSDPALLPLCDLLFYNPPPTIFQSKAQEDLNNNNKDDVPKKPAVSPKKRSSRSNSIASIASEASNNAQEDFDKNDVPEKSAVSPKKRFDDDDSLSEPAAGDEPMLMLDESGNIVIKNPNALANDKDKKPEAKMKSSTTYSSFRRRERTKNIWNTEETGIFYTALEIVGTDFSLMEAVFFKDRGRSRKQLKQKFKREEKINRDYVDSILYKSLRNRSKLPGNVV